MQIIQLPIIGDNPYIVASPEEYLGIEGTIMTTITVNTPAKIAVPRGSRVAAVWFGRLLTRLGDMAEKRAERRAVANRMREASEVRAYAQFVMSQDPRFAADLISAADRHEAC